MHAVRVALAQAFGVLVLLGSVHASPPCDCIQIGDAVYIRDPGSQTLAMTRVPLGAEYYRIERIGPASCLAPDTTYQLKIGTPVYMVTGHDPKTLLAVAPNRVYGIVQRPDALRGRDLLDLSAQLQRVSIAGSTDGYIEIVDPSALARLARIVEDAPVVSGSTPPKFVELTFWFADTVTLTRVLYNDEIEIGPKAIRLPPEFQKIVQLSRVVR